MKRAVTAGATGAIILSFSAMPALAYIDPVTGSIIVQTVVGGLATAAVALRSVREKIFGLFKSKPKDDTENA